MEGLVQGVGFRPFVFHQARQFGLAGFVRNDRSGVAIEAEGEPERLREFLRQLREAPPSQARVSRSNWHPIPVQGDRLFRIAESEQRATGAALAGPDVATCEACLQEIFDPSNRRFRYPFTTCTHCGPRFSLLLRLPYDRPNTTMVRFPMCEACRKEYEDAEDRRFHAQANACAECGPHLNFWDGQGVTLASDDEALRAAAGAVRSGQIVAVKGLGGFHLIVDARNREGALHLRRQKHREEKPFAVMAPSLAWVREQCELSDLEESLLASPESPIVLLRRRSDTSFDGERFASDAVAPGNPYLGVMLPYTPLHHLLLAELGFPVVATSGNRSDEPLCTDEREALEQLAGIADRFLVHDRPIARHVDDSLVRVAAGRPLTLRRARGYAPLPIMVKESLPPTLAVGAHQKNATALGVGQQVFLSQHIGDLDTLPAADAFRQVITGFQQLYQVRPMQIACDAHPDYLSTRFAEECGLPVTRVQHHHAHVLACMSEHGLRGPVLGVCWDGTGYGGDGTAWGGEFLRVDGAIFERRAHLRCFPLAGGDQAAREPRRAALGVLFALYGKALFDRCNLPLLRDFTPTELQVLEGMLTGRVRSPFTSSAGRLFDAVSALIGRCSRATFEGQAAMQLEFAAEEARTEATYPFTLLAGDRGAECPILDWGPAIYAVLADLQGQLPATDIAAKFHNTLAEMIVTVAAHVAEERVVLTGGCFQNRYLTECSVNRLRAAGFQPYWHQWVPPNDGGIAVGQALAVALRAAEE